MFLVYGCAGKKSGMPSIMCPGFGYTKKKGVRDTKLVHSKYTSVIRKIHKGNMLGWTISRLCVSRQPSPNGGAPVLTPFMIARNQCQPNEHDAAAMLDYVLMVVGQGQIPDSHLLLPEQAHTNYKSPPKNLKSILSSRQLWYAHNCTGVLEVVPEDKKGAGQHKKLSKLHFLFPANVDVLQDSMRGGGSEKNDVSEDGDGDDSFMSVVLTGGFVQKTRIAVKRVTNEHSCAMSNVSSSQSNTSINEGVLEAGRAGPSRAVSADITAVGAFTGVVVQCVNGRLDPAGEEIVTQAIVGHHNVMVQGCAGAGKTTLVNDHILPALRRLYGGMDSDMGKVWVSSSTALAASHLVGGSTLHSLSGMKTAAGSVQDIIKEMPGSARNRWRHVKAVVLDECGMISGQFLDKFDGVARVMGGAFHASDKVCGGLQMILVGDMFQLTACGGWVKHATTGLVERYRANLIFQANVWNSLKFRMFRLSKSHRQADGEFFQSLGLLSRMVMKLEGDAAPKGRISAEDAKKLKLLHDFFKPLLCADVALAAKACRLFPKKADCIKYNNACLAKIKQPLVSYFAHDCAMSDESKHAAETAGVFQAMTAPKGIELKVGAVVLLTSNHPGTKLMNGSQGVVVGFSKCDGVENWTITTKNRDAETLQSMAEHVAGGNGFRYPMVEFKDADGGQVSIVVFPVEFARLCDVSGQVIATRTALPLLLGYALTVHKSQGMDLDKVVTELGSAFCYGQIYTALSRTHRKADIFLLHLVNFQYCVLANPIVVAWMDATVWEDIELSTSS